MRKDAWEVYAGKFADDEIESVQLLADFYRGVK
jgi:hypothetical protein